MNSLSANERNQLNFSGGPGALPMSVLQQVQAAINAVPEVGISILGISHRSDWFAQVVAELRQNIRYALVRKPRMKSTSLSTAASCKPL